MTSEQQDSQRGWILTVVSCLTCLVLAVGIFIGVGIYQKRHLTPDVQVETTATPAWVSPLPAGALPADSESVAQADADAASVKVEHGIVQFYFASGSADLGAGAGDALAGVIKGVSSVRKLVISGFHDATGSPAKNIALANLRALNVREALLAAGVANHQIKLKKPQQITVSGTNAEARRVDVSLE